MVDVELVSFDCFLEGPDFTIVREKVFEELVQRFLARGKKIKIVV